MEPISISGQFSDPFVQDELKNFPKPFKVEEGKKGEILITVSYILFVACIHISKSFGE
jgi:hypothetical protein